MRRLTFIDETTPYPTEEDAFAIPLRTQPRRRDPLAVVKALADALQDAIESRLGRELGARDLPREWHDAQAVLADTFQARNAAWMAEAFRDDPTDLAERVARFGEEALELQQSLGQSREDAHALVDYVFDRPAGEPAQEMGGTMTTLALLAHVAGLDATECGERELARCSTPKVLAKIQSKRANRDGRGALPGIAPAEEMTAPPTKPAAANKWASGAFIGLRLSDGTMI